MSTRRFVSVPTLMALILAVATAALVAASLDGAGRPAAAHDEPTSDLDQTAVEGDGHDDADLDDRPVSAPADDRRRSRSARSMGVVAQAGPDIVLADERALTDPLAENETAALRGGLGLTDDRVVAGATATTDPVVEGACPVMTDSIRRLYLGFLEREPTTTELEGDIRRYAGGSANLEDLAAVLAGGGLFRDRYGPLADEGFVRQAYANTLRRPPDGDELDHWLAALDAGYPRGSVMLALTESAEFTRRTGTARPLSGYLNWYPSGVHWYCGSGGRDDLSIRPLIGDDLYADYMFTNGGDTQEEVALTTVEAGRTRVEMGAGTLPARFTEFRWDGLFDGAERYGDAIDIQASSQTSWVVVFYRHPIGRQRLGWNLAR